MLLQQFRHLYNKVCFISNLTPSSEYIIFTSLIKVALLLMLLGHIGGILVSMLASSVVDRAPVYKMGICCFYMSTIKNIYIYICLIYCTVNPV
jgi:hypothetical protein